MRIIGLYVAHMAGHLTIFPSDHKFIMRMEDDSIASNETITLFMNDHLSTMNVIAHYHYDGSGTLTNIAHQLYIYTTTVISLMYIPSSNKMPEVLLPILDYSN